MNETNLTCCCCGAELTPENSYQFDNNTYCANCFHDLTVECEDCGRRIYRDDAITTTSSYEICQHCYDRNYLTCERCGNAVYLDDAYYMDDDEDDEYPYCQYTTTVTSLIRYFTVRISATLAWSLKLTEEATMNAMPMKYLA